VDDPASHQHSAHHASGPFHTEREARASVAHILSSPAESSADGCFRLLEDACGAAGVELAAYDSYVLVGLAGQPPAAVAVVRGLILRAHESGEAARDGAGVVMPGGGWISGPST
jgi:hypothetical protein